MMVAEENGPLFHGQMPHPFPDRALRIDHVHIAELLPDGRTLIARAASGWAPERLALWQFDLAPESRLGQAVHNSALIVLFVVEAVVVGLIRG